MKTDLSRINLNLLIALDALLTERHVTRAAQKLFITQAAMSNLLKQLREIFKDALLVRGQASHMTLTPRASALISPVKEALQKVESIFLMPPTFDPATSSHTFTLGMSDYAEFVLLPPLIRLITASAPNINIVIKHLNFLNDAQVIELENGSIDLAVGIYPQIPDLLEVEELFTDEVVCVGWDKNPLLRSSLSLKKFAAAQHLVILYYETREQSFAEQLLAQAGYQRRATVTLPRTLAAVYALPNTPLIATVLKRTIVSIAANLCLKYLPVPFKYPRIVTTQVWHPKNNQDAAHTWLHSVVKKAATLI